MAKSKDTRRRLNPTEVHRLWSTIIRCQEAPGNSIQIEKLRPYFDNDNQLLETLTKANDERLIITNTDILKLANGEPPELSCEISLPTSLRNNTKPKHDWYCFHCHQIDTQSSDTSSESSGSMENCAQNCEKLHHCQQCFRSYHQTCAKRHYTYVVRLEADKRHSFNDEYKCSKNSDLCLLCLLKSEHSRSYAIKNDIFTPEEFHEILSYTFCPFIEDRPKKKNRIIQKIIEEFAQHSKEDISTKDSSEIICTKLALRHLVHDFINIETIQQKLQNKQYKTIAQYFDDCLKLGHVFELVFIASGSSVNGRMKDFKSDLDDIFDEMRHDFKDIFACINCYLLSNRDSDDAFWFSQTCNPPHALVFAKQKGYPYWPAKVITPRVIDDLKSIKKLEVRFFGGNHERFVVDQAYIKDIDSPIAELGISIKANSGIEKALQELRIHRDLLNNKIDKNVNWKYDNDESKMSRAERKSNSNSLDDKKDIEHKVGNEVDEQKVSISNGNGNVFQANSQEVNMPIRLKRKRKFARSLDGYETDFSVKRKKKTDLSETETDSISGDELTKNAFKKRKNSIDGDLRRKTIKDTVRKIQKKMIEGNQDNDEENSEEYNDDTEKDDDEYNDQNSENDKEEREDDEKVKKEKTFEKLLKKRGRKPKIKRNRFLKKNVNYDENDEDDDEEIIEKQIYKSKKREERKRSSRETEILSPTSSNNENRRNRKQTDRFSPIKVDLDLIPRKRGRPSKAYLELVETEKSQVERERQKVILSRKKIIIPISNHVPAITAKKSQPLIFTSSSFKLPENFTFPDDSRPIISDDEDYPFDDEQLEKEILDYEEFKESESQFRKIFHSQQQYLLHNQRIRRFNSLNNHASKISSNIQSKKCDNRNFIIPDVPETYIDFSNDNVYVPNNKTKRMLNFYLHEASTNPDNGVSKGDVLANFYLRKNSLTDEMLEEHETEITTKKRGRPPKAGGEADEIAKARMSLEKSYLQDTACDRECLQKNSKAFKRFRLFVTMQNKEENEKIKHQIDELTKKIELLERDNYELQSRLTTQNGANTSTHHFNPDVLNILHKKIEETKRHIWCTNCLSHQGIYHCCYNVHYCSNACQTDHWPKHYHVCLQKKGITSYKRENMIDKAVMANIPLTPPASLMDLSMTNGSAESSCSSSTKSPTKSRKQSLTKSPKNVELINRKSKKNISSPRKNSKEENVNQTLKKGSKTLFKGKKSKKSEPEVRVKRKYVRKNFKDSQEEKKTKNERKKGLKKKEKKIKEEIFFKEDIESLLLPDDDKKVLNETVIEVLEVSLKDDEPAEIYERSSLVESDNEEEMAENGIKDGEIEQSMDHVEIPEIKTIDIQTSKMTT